MTTTPNAATPGGTATPLSRALDTIRKLKAQLAEQAGRAPIAVVGVGLRLPGGIDTPDAYWAALAEGRDLVRPMPPNRMAPFTEQWQSLPRRGGFLDEALTFDAAFFGISPREARAMDPQQRLLLEVCVEALEQAALPPDRLAGQRAGLYLGITHQDYRDWEPRTADAYWATGNGHCFAAGRVAYALGLTGPAVAVDTACSSSLVALHQAATALRRGECDVALAAGVNLILSPRSTRLLSREMGALAPDGLCKAFDARANGFTRGEGCVVLVLKRLDAAVRDNDTVYAVVKGSALNQDGRSAGFTAPNVLSQVALIRAALADAELTPADIGLIETHGTGTSLGDPIEMAAVVTALGEPKGPDDPLYVGAAKTNVGHLEAAAGLTGVVKAILSLRHGAVPPLVHFTTLNPRIDLSGTAIRLPTRLAPWTTPASGRHAGVSSFGMSGTNAHVILGTPESAGVSAPSPVQVDVPGFELSARTPEQLRELAARFARRLADLEPERYAAFAYTASAGRVRHRWRARVAATDPVAARAALEALAVGAPSPAVTVGEGDGDPSPFDLPRQVVELPHYPWQRQRFAPDVDVPQPTAPAAADAAVTAPAAAGTDQPLYEVGWEPLSGAASSDATLVLAGDDPDLLRRLAEAADGRDPVLLPAPGAAGAAGRLPTRDEEWAAFWRSRPAGERAILVLAPAAHALPADLSGDALTVGAALCASVTSAVRSAPPGHRVVLLTRGARRVGPSDVVPATVHGLLHGLAPVLGLEYATWGGVLDLPTKVGPADLRAALRGLDGLPGEDLLAVREGRLYAARLRRVPAGYETTLTIRSDARYLVTGGLGAIGRAIVADLAARGARHLLLVGRRAEHELPSAAVELLARLRGDGVDVRYESADCADAAALAAVLDSAGDEPPLRGVVHAAGTLARAALSEMDEARFTSALAAKFAGAWWLHLLVRDRPLDFFVLTSSVSALWGTQGYGGYAAANGGLDLIAGHRVAHGLPATSVAYGPWAVDGMVDEAALADLARGGVDGISAATGCAALTDRAPGAEAVLVCCPVRWPRFVATMSARRERAVFRSLVDVTASAAVAADADGGPGEGTDPAGAAPDRDRLLGLPEKARPAAAREVVAQEVARVLGYPDRDAIRDDQGLFDLGLDSMMVADLVEALGTRLGVRLLSADVFDHPTVADLAAAVLTRLGGPVTNPHTPSVTASTGAARLPALPAVDVATPATVDPGRSVAAPPVPVAHGPGASESGTARPRANVADPVEPIAIVGMAGRFPGADSVEELWRLLLDGRDGVGPVPPDRWDAAALHDPDPVSVGTVTTDQGGFLRDIVRFDAGFFDIPAREADSLDPQHRLLLECAWHALEDAGIDATSLRGSRTGVFVGISNSDYARILERGGLAGLDAYFGTGTSLNAAAGRIAYLLGLHGPALAVDTACSSSLVAIHLAVRSLRSGESEMALVGGVNVIADPAASVAVSRAHMLSPDGRCKTFSAAADGFVRSEAVAVLVLKPLSAARRDGDRVLAVLLGSAVNSDGASSGLTAPNGTAQREVLAAALADAGVSPADVSYLEAHGTGTALGDPVEMGAAWEVLGAGRPPGEPLHVGSVKSNVGHCESAAGMVGVIKTVLALRHGILPANLHCAELNPRIPWSEMNVRVVDATMPWRAAGGRPRVAGVSGFGFSGTNAHVVVAEAPVQQPEPEPPTPAQGPWLLPLSAPDDEGLARLTAAWQDRLATSADDDLPALVGLAGAGRAHLPVRRAVLGASVAELREALSKPPRRAGRTRPPRVAFLFAGQGAQYFGMARDLYESERVFRETFDECDRLLAPQLGVSLRDVIWYGEDRELLNQTSFTQPALVALELSLADLWASWGVTASAVIGHSVGEIAAAIHAGVLSLADGLTLISHRARLMQGTRPGAMLAVAAPAERVEAWLAGTGLDIAAVNGPKATVVAGPPEEVDEFAAARKAEGVTVHRLVVSHAFHSRLMEPMLADFRAALAPLSFRPAELPIVANLSGRLARADEYDADYWCRHVRHPVRFHEGIQQLRALDVDVFLEIGPGRTLTGLVTAAGAVPAGGAVASLRRGVADRRSLLEAVHDLYEQGQRIRWEAVQPRVVGRPDQSGAPRYPFADTRYWARVPDGSRRDRSAGDRPAVPHWGRELRSPALSGRVFEFPRSARFPAYLTDHRLYGTVVTPAASHLSTMLSALGPDGSPLTLVDLVCPRALVIRDDERYDVQLTVDGQGDRLAVQSLLDPDRGLWQEHLSARLRRDAAGVDPAVPDREAFIARARRHITGADFYGYFRALGYTLGPSFRWIADVWLDGDEALVRYAPPTVPDDPRDYEVYPGLIDSCFQSIAGFLVDDAERTEEEPSLAIPFSASVLRFVARPAPGAEVWGHVRVRSADPLPGGRLRVHAADLHMFTDDGRTVLAAEDFRVRHAPRDLLVRSLREQSAGLYELTWVPGGADAPVAAGADGYRVALLAPADGAADVFADAVRAAGHTAAADPAAADLVLDLRFCELSADVELREAVLALADSVREAPPHVPYAVVAPDGPPVAPVREALWGLLAAVEAEEPRRRLLRVQWAGGGGRAAASLVRVLTDTLRTGVPETRLRVDGDRVEVARLTVRPQTAVGRCPDGVLVTGGLGALGLSVARLLAAGGVRSITLMGRSAPDAYATEVIDRLTADGVRVAVVHGDVRDPVACAAAVAAATAQGPLRAVFHLAGTTADGAFATLTPEAFDAVLSGKAHGARTLAEALRGHDVEAFVLFSSVSSVLGAVGQANYAAANGYLNGLAMALRAEGVPATAVCWGPWEPDGKGGLAATEVVRSAAARLGVRALTDAEAGPLLFAAMAAGTAGLVAVAVDLARFAAAAAGHPRAALVSGLVAAPVDGAGEGAAADGGRQPAPGWLRERLNGVSAAERHDQLRAAISALVAEALGERGSIDETRGFADLGVDSVMAIDLRARLSHALGTDLPATVALDNPTVLAMTSFVEGRVFGLDAPVVTAGAGNVPASGGERSKSSPVEWDQEVDPAALSLDDLVAAAREDLALDV
ncbi:MAG TPA: SDR family NAD(P)-dependent oxidoreductase [Micromonosporaceae bacterium]